MLFWVKHGWIFRVQTCGYLNMILIARWQHLVSYARKVLGVKSANKCLNFCVEFPKPQIDNISALTYFTNPRMHLFHIPQCFIQNRNELTIVGYGIGAFWELWNWAIDSGAGLLHKRRKHWPSIEIETFSSRKMYFKMSSSRLRPLFLGFDVLKCVNATRKGWCDILIKLTCYCESDICRCLGVTGPTFSQKCANTDACGYRDTIRKLKIWIKHVFGSVKNMWMGRENTWVLKGN